MATYGNFALTLVQNYLAGKTLKALLVTSAYAQNVDTHTVVADVTGEIVGGTYAAGGVALTGVSASYDAASDTVQVHADDITFASLDAPDVAGIIFYVETGNATTSTLLAFDRYSSPIDASGGGPLTHEIEAVGFIALTAGA